jgi:hypothetical protein
MTLLRGIFSISYLILASLLLSSSKFFSYSSSYYIGLLVLISHLRSKHMRRHHSCTSWRHRRHSSLGMLIHHVRIWNGHTWLHMLRRHKETWRGHTKRGSVWWHHIRWIVMHLIHPSCYILAS